MHEAHLSLLRSAVAVMTALLALVAAPANVRAELPKTIRVFTTPAAGTAQATYTASVLAARKSCAQALDAALKSVMSSGNLTEANAINAVKTAIESGGDPPAANFKSSAAIQAKASYDAAITKARTQYVSVLQTAQKAVLASGDLKEANVIQDEINEVTGIAPVASTAVPPKPGNAPAGGSETDIESANLIVSGKGYTSQVLQDNELGWGNRAYRFQNVPDAIKGARFTRTNGGSPAEIKVRARRETTLLVFTDMNERETRLPGWQRTKISFTTTGNKADLVVFTKTIKAGQEIKIPQVNWAGTMVVVTGQ